MAFKALGLHDRLVQGILATGYTAPTEIQARAIPHALAGKDIIGSAQTGTGKTAAFVLPILNTLANTETRTHHTKALILTPTRELAQQIEDAIRQYGRFMQLRTISLYGGTNIQNQLRKLHQGIDIVIATPGRLLDHIQRRSVDFSHLSVLVLDEADRMFDMGFIADVKRIISKTPSTRQTLLFSATMSKEVRALVKDIQKNPELIEIGEQRTPAKSVSQHFYSITQDKKSDLLLHILKSKTLDSVLVFSRTKHGADKISHKLDRNGIKSIAIHSDRTQAQRMRALAGFKQGQYNVLVATDVAARGIDVDGISHVINYDIPSYAEDYIHRIGRTGRASLTGDAITFVARDEVRHLKKIEAFTKKRFDLKKYPDFDYTKVIEKEPDTKKDVSGDRDQRFNRSERNVSRFEKAGDSFRKGRFDKKRTFGSKRPDGKRRFPEPAIVDKVYHEPRPYPSRTPRVEKETRNSIYSPKPESSWRTLIDQNETEAGKKKKKLKKKILPL
jgi:ATP-dependent RNA helicase RhlE